MKLITINTHSLIEENYQKKLEQFVDFICEEQPDLIAMQEVNQSIDAPVYDLPLIGYNSISDKMPPVRKDNHALQAARHFHNKKLPYHWTWLPVKLGYEKYDEGMAIFSKAPITDIDHFYISSFNDYTYWKTRSVLGVKIAGSDDWFYTLHMGWWNDEEESFAEQWGRLEKQIARSSSNIWLLGDFNSPAEVRNEGYDLMKASGFYDTYELAEKKDDGITVEGIIDGWRDKISDSKNIKGMRIDHIWSKEPCDVKSSKIIFNGENAPIISDHFGIMIEVF